jgi:hypothetical protein
MADVTDMLTDTLVRGLARVARTADEIRNGVLLGRANGDIRLEPVPHRAGERPRV